MAGMLGIVEDRLPFGSEQWVSVASMYNAQLPSGWPDRDSESLKRKCMNLKNKRKPTGDPDCPAEVKRAKIAFRQIEARCGVSTLHDVDSDSAGNANVEPEEEPDIDGSDDESEVVRLDGFPAELYVTADELAPRQDSDAPMSLSASAGSGDSLSAALPASRQSHDAAARPPSTPPLTATGRAGLTPTQLVQLSTSLPKSTANQQTGSTTTYLSQTAQRRIRLDKMLAKVASETSSSAGGADSSLIGVLMMMDERQATREAELRREREEREAAREERERQFRLEMAHSQSARDAQNQQMIMLVMAKLFGTQSAKNDSDM